MLSSQRPSRDVVAALTRYQGLTALCLWPALCLWALPATAQTFRLQCPAYTAAHPDPGAQATKDAITAAGLNATYASVFPGGLQCQQISGGDGFATMADGTQTYLFAFGPLSGLKDIYNGLPGTQTPSVFNTVGPLGVGTPSTLVGMPDGHFDFNGAIGLAPDPYVGTLPDGSRDQVLATACAGASPPAECFTGHVDPRPIMDVGVLNGNEPAPMMAINEDDEFFLTLTNVGQIMRPDLFEQHTVHFHGYPNASAFYDGVPDASIAINIGGSFTYYYLAPDAGTYFWHCHITPPEHLQMGMVGQLFVRPRQNRVSGNLQEALAGLETPPTQATNPTHSEYERLRKRCGGDILCSTPIPAANPATNDGTRKYAYNDGDGSTAYDVEYPIQMHGFDPNFHFVGMTFNPEAFAEMKDKYFLLNGRSYPDTVGGYVCGDPLTEQLPACQGKSPNTIVPGPMQTQASDGTPHTAQPLPTVINIPLGGRALLRISDLNVTEFHTLASLGMPMHVIAVNARLLRDQDGVNMAYDTNSITLGGGESLDVILDACSSSRDATTGACNNNTYQAGQKFYLYTPQLDHLSNDAENFGGMMTEVNICASVNPDTKVGTGCPST
jgi:FtsP/CotA-like multicopper oxidase with cupredoxin domain